MSAPRTETLVGIRSSEKRGDGKARMAATAAASILMGLLRDAARGSQSRGGA
jgi:hypothetical protein